MMAMTNLKMLQENTSILFEILENEDQFKQILAENMQEFYVGHLLNYINSYSKELTNVMILAKAVGFLERIFNHVIDQAADKTQVLYW